MQFADGAPPPLVVGASRPPSLSITPRKKTDSDHLLRAHCDYLNSTVNAHERKHIVGSWLFYYGYARALMRCLYKAEAVIEAA